MTGSGGFSVFGLSPQDTILLRWKIIDLIQAKEVLRRLARRIRFRQYSRLSSAINETESIFTQLSYQYEDLWTFMQENNITFVWPHLGEVWDNYNILAFDRRWN